MLPIIHQAIEQYLDKYSIEEDPVLTEMQAYGESIEFPLIGPQVGRLLYILASTLKAKRILEMGSGFGYSAFWFAKALPESGKVIQTEFGKHHCEKSREFFEKGKMLEKTEIHHGNSVEIADQLEGPFDIVLIDADKEYYPLAFQKTKDKISPGGLLIADNTLWFGRVLDQNPDEGTRGILDFTKLLFEDSSFFSCMLPVRDGVAIGLKTKKE